MHFGTFDLSYLLPFIAVGFAAQLVDGALGMAFGVISNTLLVVVMGVPPAIASQRVHLVECFTTALSAISHLLHGNVDKRLFWRLLLPGMVGGIDGSLAKRFVGTTLAGRIFAKTGTLNASSALAGYMVGRSGRRLTFASYAGDVPEGVAARAAVDAALVLIADAN